MIGKPLNYWGYRLEPRDGGTNVTEYFRFEPNLVDARLLDRARAAAGPDESQWDADNARKNEGGMES